MGLQASARDSALAEGIRLAGMEPRVALVRFERILALDSTDVAANWHATIALNDLALPLGGPAQQAGRDSLYVRAERYGRRAVRLAPGDAGALFALGLVLGNSALTRGISERTRMGVEVFALAQRALAADSMLDGAHHLLGRWNYEVMKLSGFQRFIAKHILGGGVFGRASWEEAQRHLERAVALDPARIYHRLDLARVYLARKDPVAARTELRRIVELPARAAADSSYRREAAELMAQLEGPRR